MNRFWTWTTPCLKGSVDARKLDSERPRGDQSDLSGCAHDEARIVGLFLGRWCLFTFVAGAGESHEPIKGKRGFGNTYKRFDERGSLIGSSHVRQRKGEPQQRGKQNDFQECFSWKALG